MANKQANIFPQRLCQALDESGLTQEKLAQTIGIAPPNVSFWKSGRNLPKTRHLLAIANILNVSLDWLFGIENEERFITKEEHGNEGV